MRNVIIIAEQVVKVIWHKDALLRTRTFNRIRQVAPVCTSTKYTLPWTHLTVSRLVQPFYTAYGRESQYFIMGRLFSPLKLPLPMGDLDSI